jgi:hypothetical protein
MYRPFLLLTQSQNIANSDARALLMPRYLRLFLPRAPQDGMLQIGLTLEPGVMSVDYVATVADISDTHNNVASTDNSARLYFFLAAQTYTGKTGRVGLGYVILTADEP